MTNTLGLKQRAKVCYLNKSWQHVTIKNEKKIILVMHIDGRQISMGECSRLLHCKTFNHNNWFYNEYTAIQNILKASYEMAHKVLFTQKVQKVCTKTMHFLKCIQTDRSYSDDLLFICIIQITFLKVQMQKQVIQVLFFFFK